MNNRSILFIVGSTLYLNLVCAPTNAGSLGDISPSSGDVISSLLGITDLRGSILDSKESVNIYGGIIIEGSGQRLANSNTVSKTFYPMTRGISGTFLYNALEISNRGKCSYNDQFSRLMENANYTQTKYTDDLEILCKDYVTARDTGKDTYSERVRFEERVFSYVYQERMNSSDNNEGQNSKEHASDDSTCRFVRISNRSNACDINAQNTPLGYEIFNGSPNDEHQEKSRRKWLDEFNADQVRYCKESFKYIDDSVLSTELMSRSEDIRDFLKLYAELAKEFDKQIAFDAAVNHKLRLQFTGADDTIYRADHPAANTQFNSRSVRGRMYPDPSVDFSSTILRNPRY